jgi:hypothetical protein
MATEDESPWLTARRSAARLKVSYSTFMRRQRYEIPHRQDVPGGPLLFHVHDLDMWAVRNTHQPVS